MTTTERVLQYLLDNAGWHYGLDIVKAGISNRAYIYFHLDRLIQEGYVEDRVSTEKPLNPDCLPRHEYRATGKLMPVHEEELVPA